MGIAVAKIDVINRALRFLGETPVISDTPETEPGKMAVANFDFCRRELLRRYQWNFAVTRATLTRVGSAPFDFSDMYELSEDVLRILQLNGQDAPLLTYDLGYDSVGKRRVLLISNSGASTIKIKYIADNDQLHLWDPLALKCLALWLALDIAYAATGKREMIQQLNALLSEELKDAVAVDGQERPPTDFSVFTTQQSRVSTFDLWQNFLPNVIIPP